MRAKTKYIRWNYFTFYVIKIFGLIFGFPIKSLALVFICVCNMMVAIPNASNITAHLITFDPVSACGGFWMVCDSHTAKHSWCGFSSALFEQYFVSRILFIFVLHDDKKWVQFQSNNGLFTWFRSAVVQIITRILANSHLNTRLNCIISNFPFLTLPFEMHD